jgi:hypothetical protein
VQESKHAVENSTVTQSASVEHVALASITRVSRTCASSGFEVQASVPVATLPVALGLAFAAAWLGVPALGPAQASEVLAIASATSHPVGMLESLGAATRLGMARGSHRSTLASAMCLPMRAGGERLHNAFLADGLVDELILDVTPTLEDEGLRLVLPKGQRGEVRLLATRELGGGVVQLHWAIAGS